MYFHRLSVGHMSVERLRRDSRRGHLSEGTHGHGDDFCFSTVITTTNDRYIEAASKVSSRRTTSSRFLTMRYTRRILMQLLWQPYAHLWSQWSVWSSSATAPPAFNEPFSDAVDHVNPYVPCPMQDSN